MAVCASAAALASGLVVQARRTGPPPPAAASLRPAAFGSRQRPHAPLMRANSHQSRRQQQQQLLSWRRRQRAPQQLQLCRASAAPREGSEQSAVTPASLVWASSDDEPVPLSQGSVPALSSSDQATSASSSSDAEISDADSGSEPGAVTIDLQLPRRSLLVQFTCNKCGGRSERLVNPVAWNKGLVIAQCQHCPAWHKLADAANLVEEIRYADLEDE